MRKFIEIKYHRKNNLYLQIRGNEALTREG